MIRQSLMLSLGLLVAGCGGGSQTASGPDMPPSAKSSLLNQPVPSFRRDTLSGDPFNTDHQRGRVLVVKFFAEYCKPCQKTLPAAQKVAENRPEVSFLGISEDEFAAAALRQVQRYNLGFPVILDRDQVLAGRFRVSELPASFVVDAQGVVVWAGGEQESEASLERAVDAASTRKSPNTTP